MEYLLNPIHTRGTSDLTAGTLQSEQVDVQDTHSSAVVVHSPDEALKALTSKPDLPALEKTLRWLNSSALDRNGFNILRPGPKATQILFALVNEIVPDYWALLKEEAIPGARRIRKYLLQCLRSTGACGAIVSRLHFQISELKSQKGMKNVRRETKIQPAETLIEALEDMISPAVFLANLWKGVQRSALTLTGATLVWKEVISLFGSGKLLSLVGELGHILNEVRSDILASSWIGQGSQYATWLGVNLSQMIDDLKNWEEVSARKPISLMLGKALTMGYAVEVVEAAYSRLLCGEESVVQQCRAIMQDLHGHEQKTLLYSLIRALSNQQVDDKLKHLRGAAAVISALSADVPSLQSQLIQWLTGSSPEAVGHSHATRRTVVLSLAPSLNLIKDALWKALGLFSDKLFIKHAPILHQEVNTQILLMLAGHVSLRDSGSLFTVSKSAVYLNGISNHLAASSPRARFLGMVVGSAISGLLDEPDKQLNFKGEDSENADWGWYKNLINMDDETGFITDIRPAATAAKEVTKPNVTKQFMNAISNNTSQRRCATPKTNSRIVKIEELDESSESEGDDLLIYERPDFDPSDDDEDPTLVQRNKPTAPVYIRDLLSGLRDTENFDKHTLALRSATSLIRRKAAFGTEVTDHIEELGATIVTLKDRWELDDFTKIRLQTMQAVLVAEPLRMGQWFSKTFYNGDFSIGQRVSILTTLGLGAREIAGVGNDDADITGTAASINAFPSQRLPEKLHNQYFLEAAPMNSLSTRLERTMIQPLAAAAADKVTGPNALKVHTFSSRMEVEKKRQKPVSNALAKIVAEGFFFPLTGQWQVHTQAFGNNAPQTSPLLLSHLLKTLSLILHAAGPSALALPQLTTEFWSFLLNIRSSSNVTDPRVLEALLFSFLTLLDVNVESQRRLAEEHAKELLETQEWAGDVLGKLGGGDEEGERSRMLAAGVLVRCREVVEKYQRLLMGDLVNFV
ncbi:MAG: hypothetical protein Q9163_002122 [Psora crenata]